MQVIKQQQDYLLDEYTKLDTLKDMGLLNTDTVFGYLVAGFPRQILKDSWQRLRNKLGEFDNHIKDKLLTLDNFLRLLAVARAKTIEQGEACRIDQIIRFLDECNRELILNPQYLTSHFIKVPEKFKYTRSIGEVYSQKKEEKLPQEPYQSKYVHQNPKEERKERGVEGKVEEKEDRSKYIVPESLKQFKDRVAIREREAARSRGIQNTVANHQQNQSSNQSEIIPSKMSSYFSKVSSNVSSEQKPAEVNSKILQVMVPASNPISSKLDTTESIFRSKHEPSIRPSESKLINSNISQLKFCPISVKKNEPKKQQPIIAHINIESKRQQHINLFSVLKTEPKKQQVIIAHDIRLPQRLQNKVSASSNIGVQCPICIIQIRHSELSLLSCGHMFHKECFGGYAKQQISNKKLPLLCPSEECRLAVDTRDIQEELSKELLEKYYQFSFQTYVQKNHKDTTWCPTAGCSSVFEFDPNLNEYRCRGCKKNYCLRCQSEMHTGMTCKEYSEVRNMPEEDKEFIKFVAGKKFKQCPNCKFWVERSEGCDHMTCRCAFEFCYLCGAEYGTCSCEEEEEERSNYSDY